MLYWLNEPTQLVHGTVLAIIILAAGAGAIAGMALGVWGYRNSSKFEFDCYRARQKPRYGP